MNKYINPYRLFHGAMIPNWLLMRPNSELNSSAKMVYARLGQYAGKKGVAFPCKRTLAVQVGLSSDAVDRCLDALEALGLIEVTLRPQPGGSNRSNEYRFLEHPWMWTEEDEEEDSPEEGGGGTGRPPRGDRTPPYRGQVSPQRGDRTPPNLRESVEANQETNQKNDVDASLTTSPNTPPEEREGCAPHDLNKNPKDAATAELSNAEPFDLQALIAAKTARERRSAAEALISSSSQKTLDEKARKQAKRYQAEERRKARAKADAESGSEPLEAPEKTPRAQMFHVWREELASAFPDYPIPRQWSGREWGQAQLLLEKYDLDQVEIAIAYVIRNWEALGQRFFKGKADPTPSIGVILALDASIFPQSVVWAQHGAVIEEYRAYGDDNVRRPEELEVRYIESRKQLKNLGLI